MTYTIYDLYQAKTYSFTTDRTTFHNVGLHNITMVKLLDSLVYRKLY